MSNGHPPETLAHGVPPVAVSSTSTLVNKTGSWKYIRPIYRDRVAPCNEGCPVGIDIEGYMNLLREGHILDALDLLLRENPMPATTGRVCYHPCENACNRRYYDGAVSIHAVERMLGDRALDAPLPPAAPPRAERVAVVGSGPAGLACAFHLSSFGYRVTMYESAPEPGGILRYGIPEYRLPKAILAREIERIAARGVEMRCGMTVGVELPWEALDRFDAVFLGMGVHRSLPLGIDGESTAGIRAGLSFLREVNEGERPHLGDHVVVIGGGNTAMDCARTALRLGSKATVLYRRTRAEMPAIDEEVEEATEEGVEFRFLAAPTGVMTQKGKLTGLTCTAMKLGDPDESGRRRPVPVPNSEFFVEADTVLVAIGEGPDFEGLPDAFKRTKWVLETDRFGRTSREGMYAGGDVTEEPHTVAHALGSGKRAAVAIDHQLKVKAGEPVTEPDAARLRIGRIGNLSMTRWKEDDPIDRVNPANMVVPFEDVNLDHFPSVEVNPDRMIAAEESKERFVEVNRGLTSDQALAEAARCFNCGVCNSCELCLIYCPDVAISRRPGGGFYIDYEYCKGCGLCNAECPRGAMAMTREGL